MSRKLVGRGLEEAQMSNATRAVEEAPRMAVDRPQRFGFRAAVNAISVAAMVNLIALAASAVGALIPHSDGCEGVDAHPNPYHTKN